MGECGLSRTRREPSGVPGEGSDTVAVRPIRPAVRGKAVATRLRKAGSDDPASRDERAEGLLGCSVAGRHCGNAVQRPCDVGIRRPRQETYRRRTMRRRSWLAAMRLQVAARESCFLWRRTDDGCSSCVLCTGEHPAKVMARGHYGLGVCTDETSADTLAKEVPARRAVQACAQWCGHLHGRISVA